MLAFALLALMVLPLPVLASDGQPAPLHACEGAGCRAQPAWTVPLDGTWAAGTRAGGTPNGGTVPAVGQAYVAAGGGVAVVGTGLGLAGYRLSDGRPLWKVTLYAPAGTTIMSVRAWTDVVTVGLLGPASNSRTEVVIAATTGAEVRRYPAAVFGGAVAASAATTVVIGPAAVTSYANATGRVRWTHKISGGQSWRTDGLLLYLAQSRGGGLSSAPVTALKVINLGTGSVGTLTSILGRPFSGTLAIAAGGAVVFASPSGVTAYSERTGATLWTMRGAVPEGTDPATGLVYLTSGAGVLLGVDPAAGIALTSVPSAVATGPAAVFVVRDGTALGLTGGADGQAWGYDLAAGRVTWNSTALPWPHFYSDLSGLGGSADSSGGTVVITACPHLAKSPGICADPELVAFSLGAPPGALQPGDRVLEKHMSGIEQPLRAADQFQQRSPALAFPVAVWSKFKDDRAGNLAALIAYYGFAALFPLLLVLVTVLNIVLKNDPSLRTTLVDSAVSQYPVIGPQIQRNLGSLPPSGLPLVIGFVLLLLGARGVAGAMQNAMFQVWDIAEERRPKFLMTQLLGLALVFNIGIGLIVTSFLSGVAGGVGHVLNGTVAHVGTVLVSLVLNVGVFWLGFRLATAFEVRWRDLRTGAVIAAVCWQVLQLVGGYVVGHQLHRASELYGTFGIVLGLLAWLYLEAEVTLYAAEVDVVLARHLWPRSIMPADSGEPGEPARAAEPVPPAESVQAAAPLEPVQAEPVQAEPVQAEPAQGAEGAPPGDPAAPAGQDGQDGQDGQPDEAAPVSVPAPRAAAERGGDDENRTARWISRARRVVGRR